MHFSKLMMASFVEKNAYLNLVKNVAVIVTAEINFYENGFEY